ncbi:MAG: hypothetical protein V4613_14825 [Bacteroidota bacterium]
MGKRQEENYTHTNFDAKTFWWVLLIVGFFIFGAVSATEDYSNGERIGFITKFSQKGRYWKSWEGELNLTQTGMNTSSLFDFSVDNDSEYTYVIKMIDSAVNNGWKVKITYHETYFKNWLSNRGETNYFVKDIQILDRTTLGNNSSTVEEEHPVGHVIDTVYVVIDKSELFKKK